MNGTTSNVRRRVWFVHGAEWYAIGLFIAYAVVLFWHHNAPSLTDFSDWTYEGVLLRNRLLGRPDLAHVLKLYPVPNSAVTIGIAVLAMFFSWQLAAKLWLCFIFTIFFFVMKHMIRTCRSDSVLWLIAPSALILNVNLWYGFVNFQLGLCWAILVASMLLRDEPREWLYGLVLTLAFFAHMIPFVFGALLLILYALQTRRFRLLWQLTPGVLLTIWYMVGRFLFAHNADGDAGMTSPVRTFSAAFWAYKANSWLKSFGWVNPGTPNGSVTLHLFGPSLFLLLFILNAILAAIMGWCFISAMISAYRGRKKERFIWTGSLIFFFLYLLMPGAALGISDPGGRLCQVMIAVAIFLGVAGGNKRLMNLAAGCAILLSIAVLVLFETIVFVSPQQVATSKYIPHRIVVFSHIPNHVEDRFLTGLEEGDMELRVWPTAMFLDTKDAKFNLR